jgi:ABC-type protease/lipase transport system fused ATPase/permease subunit
MAAAPDTRRSELGVALRACRDAFIGVGVMSCMINLLYLTGSIFMLEVYDRVLPSRSVPTLIGLIVLAAGLYIAQGGLDSRRRQGSDRPRHPGQALQIRRHQL